MLQLADFLGWTIRGRIWEESLSLKLTSFCSKIAQCTSAASSDERKIYMEGKVWLSTFLAISSRSTGIFTRFRYGLISIIILSEINFFQSWIEYKQFTNILSKRLSETISQHRFDWKLVTVARNNTSNHWFQITSLLIIHWIIDAFLIVRVTMNRRKQIRSPRTSWLYTINSKTATSGYPVILIVSPFWITVFSSESQVAHHSYIGCPNLLYL